VRVETLQHANPIEGAPVSKTVLLVDDSTSFRSMVAPALAAKGFKVVEAATGEEARALAQQHKPDLIIVDGLLPDIDGITFIASLRESGDKTRIVFVSAFWRDVATFTRLTRDLGVALVVHKPVIPSVFAEMVDAQVAEVAPPPKIDAKEANLQRAMAKLRASYARTLKGRVAELSQVVARAREKSGDAAARADVVLRSHSLRGTAGSYGFTSVGDAAGKIEDILGGIAPPEPGDPWDAIARAVEEATRAAEAIAAEQPDATSVNVAGWLLVVSTDAAFLEHARKLADVNLVGLAVADGADDALRRARTQSFDAALIDTAQAGGDAFKLACDLRSLPGYQGLPLAFVSERARLEERVAAMHAGASLTLDKPLEGELFGVAMRELLATRHAMRPRILLLDDDPNFGTQAEAILHQARMNVRRLEDPSRVLEELEEFDPSLLLLDVMLPAISGYDVCKMLRTLPRWRDLPVVFLTARTGVESRVAAFEAGGDDYLPKPIVPEELLARIEVRVDRARLLRERLENDPLTGLSLRRVFVEGLRARLADAQRKKSAVTLCLLDVDNLRRINDEHGHACGDRVLAALGRLLMLRFRGEDLRGRSGGDELVLAFPGERAATVREVIARVQRELAALSFQDEQGKKVHVSFSVGLAVYPEDGATPDALLASAARRLSEPPSMTTPPERTPAQQQPS